MADEKSSKPPRPPQGPRFIADETVFAVPYHGGPGTLRSFLAKLELDQEGGRQLKRVLRVLLTLYPPHGLVPDDVSTKTVHQQVVDVLDREAKDQGLTGKDKPKAPGPDTVDRALGRRA